MVALDLSCAPARGEDHRQGHQAKGQWPSWLSTSALIALHVCLERPGAVLNSNSSIRVAESVARDLMEAIFV